MLHARLTSQADVGTSVAHGPWRVSLLLSAARGRHTRLQVGLLPVVSSICHSQSQPPELQAACMRCLAEAAKHSSSLASQVLNGDALRPAFQVWLRACQWGALADAGRCTCHGCLPLLGGAAAAAQAGDMCACSLQPAAHVR